MIIFHRIMANICMDKGSYSCKGHSMDKLPMACNLSNMGIAGRGVMDMSKCRDSNSLPLSIRVMNSSLPSCFSSTWTQLIQPIFQQSWVFFLILQGSQNQPRLFLPFGLLQHHLLVVPIIFPVLIVPWPTFLRPPVGFFIFLLPFIAFFLPFPLLL